MYTSFNLYKQYDINTGVAASMGNTTGGKITCSLAKMYNSPIVKVGGWEILCVNKKLITKTCKVNNLLRVFEQLLNFPSYAVVEIIHETIEYCSEILPYSQKIWLQLNFLLLRFNAPLHVFNHQKKRKCQTFHKN